MSMPKGYKLEHGYATVAKDGGMGYREISESLTRRGDKMNHSTARNVFVSAMSKIARDACIFNNVPTTQENIKRISSDPRFQEGVRDMLKGLI